MKQRHCGIQGVLSACVKLFGLVLSVFVFKIRRESTALLAVRSMAFKKL